MTKQHQFIIAVQTAILARFQAMGHEGGSMVGRMMDSIDYMDSAFEISGRIPDEVSARDAAEAYLGWQFESEFFPHKPECPDWLWPEE